MGGRTQLKIMVEEHKIIKREIKDVELGLIEISPEHNVRTEKQRANLEELKTSIKRIGLIHPIILIHKNGHYELLAGQRRFLAYQSLGEKTIPSIIINGLDSLSKKILSFTENIQRKDLPYGDTIKVCDELFKSYKGSEKERISKISKEIGVSHETVTRYLGYRLIPESVQKMVEKGSISADAAYKITTAFWPSTEKIEKIASYTSIVPKTTWERALDIARKKPTASADEIIEDSKKIQKEYQITVSFDPDTVKTLENRADEIGKAHGKKGMPLGELIKKIIEDYIYKTSG
jgi:ParB family chromosome partitioning protein